MTLIVTDFGELKELWLARATQLHDERGCGTAKNGSEWRCATSNVGCAAQVFRDMLREGQSMQQMIEWDKLQNGITS